MFVRVLGQTLGESAAHVLGMLCYSRWPYNLLHTNLSAQVKERTPLINTANTMHSSTVTYDSSAQLDEIQLSFCSPDQETGSTL